MNAKLKAEFDRDKHRMLPEAVKEMEAIFQKAGTCPEALERELLRCETFYVCRWFAERDVAGAM